jgi:hypothetical protein
VVIDAMRLGLDHGAADVLARYERWRRFDTALMAMVTDGMNRLFSNDLAPVRAARDIGLGSSTGSAREGFPHRPRRRHRPRRPAPAARPAGLVLRRGAPSSGIRRSSFLVGHLTRLVEAEERHALADRKRQVRGDEISSVPSAERIRRVLVSGQTSSSSVLTSTTCRRAFAAAA